MMTIRGNEKGSEKEDDDGKMDFWTREQRSERRAEREGRTDGGRQGREAAGPAKKSRDKAMYPGCVSMYRRYRAAKQLYSRRGWGRG